MVDLIEKMDCWYSKNSITKN